MDGRITAKIIQDSISYLGHRLTTVHVVAPRIILAEINTHRALSRNTRSNRVVSTIKLITEVENHPFIPEIRKNQRGMTAKEEIAEGCIEEWKDICTKSTEAALRMSEKEAHKQWANRVIEPYSYSHTLITSTDMGWKNFFSQRLGETVEPSMRELAYKIFEEMQSSTPNYLCIGEWHIPYITSNEMCNESIETLIQLSVARCARISITPHDEFSLNKEKDLERYIFLRNNIHLSPFEHIARVPTPIEIVKNACVGFFQLLRDQQVNLTYGNFSGWVQYRKIIEMVGR